MSLECSECERDLRSGHDPACSRYPGEPPACTCTFRLAGMDDDQHQDACAVSRWWHQYKTTVRGKVIILSGRWHDE